MSQPDLTLNAPLQRRWANLPATWRRALACLAIAWAGNVALFASDWREMFLQWWDSSTYNHVLLIPFILAWLISLRWREVVKLEPQGWWPGLAGTAVLLLFWAALVIRAEWQALRDILALIDRATGHRLVPA